MCIKWVSGSSLIELQNIWDWRYCLTDLPYPFISQRRKLRSREGKWPAWHTAVVVELRPDPCNPLYIYPPWSILKYEPQSRLPRTWPFGSCGDFLPAKETNKQVMMPGFTCPPILTISKQVDFSRLIQCSLLSAHKLISIYQRLKWATILYIVLLQTL